MSWHASPDLLRRYADGSIDDVSAYSLEAHVVACDECQAGLAALADRRRHELVWAEIDDALDQSASAPGVVERLLRRLGAGDVTARLVATTPALSLPWLGAVAAVLVFAAMTAHLDPRGVAVFLAIAPLAPLAGVAVTFGPIADPAFELSVAAPFSTVRLLLLRAVAVLATSVPLAALAALALPGLGWALIAWIVPSLALALIALALSTRVAPLSAVVLVSAGWIALVAGLALARDDRLAAFDAPVQGVLLAAGVLATIVLLRRAGREAVERHL